MGRRNLHHTGQIGGACCKVLHDRRTNIVQRLVAVILPLIGRDLHLGFDQLGYLLSDCNGIVAGRRRVGRARFRQFNHACTAEQIRSRASHQC